MGVAIPRPGWNPSDCVPFDNGVLRLLSELIDGDVSFSSHLVIQKNVTDSADNLSNILHSLPELPFPPPLPPSCISKPPRSTQLVLLLQASTEWSGSVMQNATDSFLDQMC